jgi:hypothetical protein
MHRRDGSRIWPLFSQVVEFIGNAIVSVSDARVPSGRTMVYFSWVLHIVNNAMASLPPAREDLAISRFVAQTFGPWPGTPG